MTDALDSTFQQLRTGLGTEDRLTPTHADPFFTFVHETAETLDLHRRLQRWRHILERDGFKVEIHSLRELVWDVVEASGRWDDWLEVEQLGKYLTTNRSMRDVLSPRSAEAEAGLLVRVESLLQDGSPGRVVWLTDAALLHPWFRADKLGASLHGKIKCRTVLFYPGRKRGAYGLHYLGFYPEDGGSYRTTILGGA